MRFIYRRCWIVAFPALLLFGYFAWILTLGAPSQANRRLSLNPDKQNLSLGPTEPHSDSGSGLASETYSRDKEILILRASGEPLPSARVRLLRKRGGELTTVASRLHSDFNGSAWVSRTAASVAAWAEVTHAYERFKLAATTPWQEGESRLIVTALPWPHLQVSATGVDGSPVPRVAVRLHRSTVPLGARESHAPPIALTDNSGSATIARLYPDANYSLSASHPFGCLDQYRQIAFRGFEAPHVVFKMVPIYGAKLRFIDSASDAELHRDSILPHCVYPILTENPQLQPRRLSRTHLGQSTRAAISKAEQSASVLIRSIAFSFASAPTSVKTGAHLDIHGFLKRTAALTLYRMDHLAQSPVQDLVLERHKDRALVRVRAVQAISGDPIEDRTLFLSIHSDEARDRLRRGGVSKYDASFPDSLFVGEGGLSRPFTLRHGTYRTRVASRNHPEPQEWVIDEQTDAEGDIATLELRVLPHKRARIRVQDQMGTPVLNPWTISHFTIRYPPPAVRVKLHARNEGRGEIEIRLPADESDVSIACRYGGRTYVQSLQLRHGVDLHEVVFQVER